MTRYTKRPPTRLRGSRPSNTASPRRPAPNGPAPANTCTPRHRASMSTSCRGEPLFALVRQVRKRLRLAQLHQADRAGPCDRAARLPATA